MDSAGKSLMLFLATTYVTKADKPKKIETVAIAAHHGKTKKVLGGNVYKIAYFCPMMAGMIIGPKMMPNKEPKPTRTKVREM
jgi:hypothetical protein